MSNLVPYQGQFILLVYPKYSRVSSNCFYISDLHLKFYFNIVIQSRIPSKQSKIPSKQTKISRKFRLGYQAKRLRYQANSLRYQANSLRYQANRLRYQANSLRYQANRLGYQGNSDQDTKNIMNWTRCARNVSE